MQKTLCAISAIVVGAALAAPSQAGMTNFVANLSGDNENPPTGSGATGTFSGVYDSVANSFSFEWEIFNLEGVPALPGAHIHMAPVGVNGPIIFPFSNPDGTWPLSGSAVWENMMLLHVEALFAGNLYANFHTDMHPSGELRGQILIIPAPAAPALLGVAGLATLRRRR